MKLRIRYNVEKHLIQFGDDVKTINDLKNVISADVPNLPDGYCLSLDGISPLDEGESGLISDVGLVSGDLVHILTFTGRAGDNAPTQSVAKVIQSHSLQSVTNGNELKKQEFSKLFSSPSETTMTGKAVPMEFEEYGVKKDNSQASLSSSLMMAENESGDLLSSQSVDLLTSRFKGSPHSPQLRLAVAVLHLMRELGFKYVDKKMNVEEEEEEDVDAIKMSFSHPNYGLMAFEIFLVTMTTKSILHGFSKENGEVIQKDSSNFDLHELFGKEAKKTTTTRDLAGLLRKQFRDQVGNNMIQVALRVHGFREMAELSNLPFEVQLKVLNLLDVPSLLRLSETSKFWRTLCFEPLVWKKKYLELMYNMKQPASTPLSYESWFELYKRQYKMQKDELRFKEFMFSPRELPHERALHFPPPRTSLPGVIGGRYDIWPGASHPDLDIFQPIGGHFMRGGDRNPLLGSTRGGRGRIRFPEIHPPNFPGWF